MSDPRQTLVRAKRIVVKIGSALLAPRGVLETDVPQRLASDLADGGGWEFTLVSSGAIAAGFASLRLSGMPASVVQKQAAAAIGQPRLMGIYADAFGAHDRTTAQVLLTAQDIEDRERALNARHTLAELLRRGVTPIINENDTVSYEEIRFGDNDRLSALVAQLISADALIVLTSVAGLLSDGGQGALVDVAPSIEAARAHVSKERSSVGVGGMATKLEAMRIATSCGVTGVIADGREAGIVQRVLAGQRVGTVFPPTAKASARRGWIGHAARVAGRITVDAGARRALVEQGKSLLPAGVMSVSGDFERGAIVEIADDSGAVFARSMVGYRASEIARIAGRPTGEIEGILGYRYADELAHRDDLWIDPAATEQTEREA